MEKENIKILFMGTSYFAKEILASLIEDKYKILGVVTQPDKKSGRERKIISSPIKEIARAQKIPFLQPEKLTEKVISQIKGSHPDLIIVAAYGKIIPKEIIEYPKFKSINVHPSLLPEFRGPSPIQNAILAGEKETGTTIMLVDEKMDHGDILAQKSIKMSEDDTTETLSEKLAKLSSYLLLETIPLWTEKKIKPQKQDNSKATYCQLIEREDGHIFWDSEAQDIYNKYRAFYSWPGIFSVWGNEKIIIRIKLTKIKLWEKDVENNCQIGEVIKINDSVGVKASKGAIIMEEVQVEGKKLVLIKDFINGYPNFIGSKLK
ncbi:MAG: methionyl-tRNA formyltransferase [Patescibacteria group bacterium]